MFRDYFFLGLDFDDREGCFFGFVVFAVAQEAVGEGQLWGDHSDNQVLDANGGQGVDGGAVVSVEGVQDRHASFGVIREAFEVGLSVHQEDGGDVVGESVDGCGGLAAGDDGAVGVFGLHAVSVDVEVDDLAVGVLPEAAAFKDAVVRFGGFIVVGGPSLGVGGDGAVDGDGLGGGFWFVIVESTVDVATKISQNSIEIVYFWLCSSLNPTVYRTRINT